MKDARAALTGDSDIRYDGVLAYLEKRVPLDDETDIVYPSVYKDLERV